MFQCFAMIDCSKPASKPDWIKCSDSIMFWDSIDEDCGCCDCGTKEHLEFVEINSDSVWLQCSDCAHESFCESRDCARNDNYGEE